MEPSEAALHEIIEELHITSLDESDIEAGLNDLTGLEIESGDGAGVSSAGDSAQLDEQPSVDSGISAEVRAALAVDEDGGGDGVAALEAQLRLRTPRPVGPPFRSVAQSAGNSQPQLAQTLQQLVQGQAVQAEELAAARRESQELLRQSMRARPPEPPQPRAADAVTAVATASGAFRMQMSDLTISEAVYQDLRTRPEDQLNIREWVQLRFFEARGSHRAEADRLRLEVEGLRENTFSAQTRAERAERQLARRDATVADLTQELERHQLQSREQLEQTTAQLRTSERAVGELTDKGQRFDEVARERDRLRAELERLREAMGAQSASQQQQGKDLAAASERLLQVEAERRLLQKDAESHERRARLLEETLARRDEEASELRSKVESLREKKRELARKAADQQASSTQEVRDQVNAEIKRFQEQAHADLEAVRGSLCTLHEKEVAMLQDRIEASEQRAAELQRRLEDEEHKYQALQISAARVKADLQNEITELTGSLKLRAYEAERASLTHEEVSLSRQQLEAQNEQLKQQVELLKKEYYTQEAQHREARAGERAELTSLREQLRCYVEVERELDAAIRSCAEGPLAKGKAGSDDAGKAPRSVDEALLIGTTLASAPTSAQRRIQQSLLLAQELQRRTREAAEARCLLEEVQAEAARLGEELEAARREVQYSSEPQAYLLEALRRRENEVLTIRRELKAREAEVEQGRKQVEHAVAARVQVEEDLKQLLAQRQHLDGLRAVLGTAGGEPEGPVPRAEQRGRAPCQQPQAAPRGASAAGPGGGGAGTLGAGPAWLQRLRMKLDQPDETSGDT